MYMKLVRMKMACVRCKLTLQTGVDVKEPRSSFTTNKFRFIIYITCKESFQNAKYGE